MLRGVEGVVEDNSRYGYPVFNARRPIEMVADLIEQIRGGTAAVDKPIGFSTSDLGGNRIFPFYRIIGVLHESQMTIPTFNGHFIAKENIKEGVSPWLIIPPDQITGPLKANITRQEARNRHAHYFLDESKHHPDWHQPNIDLALQREREGLITNPNLIPPRTTDDILE